MVCSDVKERRNHVGEGHEKTLHDKQFITVVGAAHILGGPHDRGLSADLVQHQLVEYLRFVSVSLSPCVRVSVCVCVCVFPVFVLWM